jgi:hypothetical protein
MPLLPTEVHQKSTGKGLLIKVVYITNNFL